MFINSNPYIKNHSNKKQETALSQNRVKKSVESDKINPEIIVQQLILLELSEIEKKVEDNLKKDADIQ